MSDNRIVLANKLVDEACTARLSGDNYIANEKLREAAYWYQDAEQYDEAQACRMLIVTDDIINPKE